jgi:hypothetical protein
MRLHADDMGPLCGLGRGFGAPSRLARLKARISTSWIIAIFGVARRTAVILARLIRLAAEHGEPKRDNKVV